MKYPVLSGDGKGVVVKLGPPRMLEEKFYQIQGLYVDQDDAGWDLAWRCFRASIFHLALHAGYSDFRLYAPWARGKEVAAATFAVSLVEDMNILTEARARWEGVLPDLAYASHLSALRLGHPDRIDNSSLRAAAKLLLAGSGVFRSSGTALARDEDKAVAAATEHARMRVEEAAKARSKAPLLTEAAQEVYAAVTEFGPLPQIPAFPFTDAHGPCDLFEGKLTEENGEESGYSLLASALAWVGLREDSTPADPAFVAEARELLAERESVAARVGKMKAFYDGLISSTRLEGLEFPKGDYGTFMRIRSELAGPIKNVRDQLMMVRNVVDDTQGHDAGAQIDTQAVMQVMATKTSRTDVFEQLEPVYKDEAWAVLVDASKSTAAFAQETRGMATCLAEIVSKLARQRTQWAMFGFNNSLQVIKDFSEPYGMTSKARIGGLAQRQTTLLPDAIQVATKALNSRDATVRILVVVSDGYPSGYNDIETKLVQVIKNISKTSVYLIGVGIDSAAIKKYFPFNCVASTPFAMMKGLAKSYFELASMF
ncbi:MAG: VWA domain-containing protein [Nitrososphaerota archaeon]|nr:VWA domain-containing protein [Nitrososphaerota archaeon]